MMSLTAVCLIAMTAVGAEGQGKAAKDESSVKAKEAFREAKALYKERRYAAAVAKFEQAYALSPSPVVFFNIGRCHERLGDVGKALRAYRDYLRQSPGTTDADAVRSTIANLERRLRESGVQQLLVFVEPSHALVEVDGKLLGTSPASVELIAGPHRMVVRAEGFETEEQSFSVELQRSMERTVNLKAAPARESVVSTSDAPRETRESLVPRGERGEDSKRDGALVPTVTRPIRVGTYVAGSVAAASLVTAIVLGVEAQRTAAGVSAAPIGTAPATAQTAHTMAAFANGAYGLAGAAAVTAVVLYFVERSR